VTPYQKAIEFYKSLELDFEEELRYFLQHGDVYSSPHFLLMGEYRDDTWFVELLIGDLKEALSHTPCRAKQVEFRRLKNDGTLTDYHTYPFEKIMKLLKIT